MTIRYRWTLAALALALPGAAFAADSDIIPVAPQQMRALGIETVPLEAARSAGTAGFPARVVIPTGQERVVAAPLPGLVESLEAAPGMAVRRGQPLARLAGGAALQMRREYLEASAEADLARRTLQRDEALLQEGIIAQARLEASRAAAQRSAALLAERREALRLAGIPEGAAGRAPNAGITVSAPLDGVVLEQAVMVGQRVEAATPLYRIARLAPLWLEMQVPLAAADGLREGLAVAVPGTAARGKVIAVGRAVDAASQGVLVRALIDRGAEALRAGQGVEARVELPAGAQGVNVPQAALVRQQEQAYVFVQQAGGFQPRPVKVLGAAGESALVSGPLQPGERVAVGGLSSLKAAWMGIGRE